MIRNYLIIAFRNIIRNKVYSLINILGLSIGLAVFILIMLYVKFEFSFDNYHTNSEKIFRVATEIHGHDHSGLKKIAFTRAPLAPAAREEISEVEQIGRIKRISDGKIELTNQVFFEKEIFFVDFEIFNIFTLPIIDGALKQKDNNLFDAVISEEISKKYFGNISPIGKIIKYMGEFDFKVIAVMKDMPNNSHFRMDIVFPLTSYEKINNNLNDWRRSSVYTYLILAEGTNILEFNDKITELYLKHLPASNHGPQNHPPSLFLQPLKSIHLHSNYLGELSANNEIDKLYLFLFIALLVLIVACFNYMNLTTANSLKRNKEVGIRKTVGAQRNDLIRQFISESFVITMLSALVAIIIVEIILPGFNSFFERDLNLLALNNIDFFVWIILIIAAVALFSSSYPAFILSSFKPVKIFKVDGNPCKKKFQLRNLFVVLQFSISTILIICTFIINNQLDYIFSKDVGYQKDQIVIIPVKGDEMTSNLETIKSEIRKFAGILNVSSSTYLPNDIRDQTGFEWPGKSEEIDVRCYASFVDYDYVDLFELKILQGRNFSRNHPSDAEGAFLINETAVEALSWSNPLDHELTHWTGKTGKVIGVLKDFNFHSLHREIEPLSLYYNPQIRNYYLSIKLAGGSIKENLINIENTISSFSLNRPIDFTFFDEIFNRTYHEEIRMSQLFKFTSIFAFFVSCMGLMGLALFAVEKRTKEIGIRKVLGATESGIAYMLSREFAKWILIANVIAWPIAWFVMNKWLQNFAYKAELNMGIFLLSGLMVLAIAILVISLQTIRAAIANPVESLRYE